MTNAELHTLAMVPSAFDAKLAELHTTMQQATDARDRAMNRIHLGAEDKQSYVGSRKVWKRTHAEVLTTAHQMADAGVSGYHGIDMVTELVELQGAEHKMAETLAEINDMDTVYAEYRWTRFFPSVTKSQPHIHRTLSCHTLHPTTVMQWAPGLSGKTDEDAVAELDEALCSVCFPTAPVALHNYVSRKSQAERDQRAAEKRDRDAIKAAKTLTDAEQAEMGRDHHGDRVTTVAKLKEIVRYAVELEVELEYWTQAAAGTRSVPNWEPEHLARRVENITHSLSHARVSAAKAEAVLLARDARQPGIGASADEIAKMRATKLKSARKDWM